MRMGKLRGHLSRRGVGLIHHLAQDQDLRLYAAPGRRDFDERFTVERMARDYLRVYRGLLDGAGVSATPTIRASA